MLALFLRLYSMIAEFRNITPKDIDYYDSAYYSLDSSNRFEDIVCLIEFAEGAYALLVLAMQSTRDFDMSFRESYYMMQALEKLRMDDSKLATLVKKGDKPRNQSFNYPHPVSIVYYDGADKWTSQRNMIDRVHAPHAFNGKNCFSQEYHLVDLHDISIEQLLSSPDPMSFILLLDKLDVAQLQLLHTVDDSYYKQLHANMSDELRKIIVSACRALFEHRRYAKESIALVQDLIEKGEFKMMFSRLSEGLDLVDKKFAFVEMKEAELGSKEAELGSKEAELGSKEAELGSKEAVLERKMFLAAKAAEALAGITESDYADKVVDIMIAHLSEEGVTEEEAKELLPHWIDRIKEVYAKKKAL
jgi:hypothetical protein